MANWKQEDSCEVGNCQTGQKNGLGSPLTSAALIRLFEPLKRIPSSYWMELIQRQSEPVHTVCGCGDPQESTWRQCFDTEGLSLGQPTSAQRWFLCWRKPINPDMSLGGNIWKLYILVVSQMWQEPIGGEQSSPKCYQRLTLAQTEIEEERVGEDSGGHPHGPCELIASQVS